MGNLLRELRLWVLVTSLLWLTARGHSQVNQKVPCFFIFGDSLVDNGNNNGFITIAKANYRPNGIDFPEGATGRFTNGRTFVDVLAQLLGFQTYIPPSVKTYGRAILGGLNLASGGAGIREETGSGLGGRTPMNQQLRKFGVIVQQMRRYFGEDINAVKSYLGKCIFFSGLGNNDYLNNYFSDDYNTASQFTPKAYADALIYDYSIQLTELYNLGARKVIVTGVPPIGCIPYEIARYNGSNGRCNEEINNAVVLFNSGLRNLVGRFNKGELQESKFVYFDSYQVLKDIISNAGSYGFDEVDKGCCGLGKNNAQKSCVPLQQACGDRSKYIFWDAFHPTEAVNIVTARSAYSSRSYAYPINVQELASL